MGYEAYAHAAAGIILPLRCLVKSKQVKAFNHNFPETMSFSPDNGKALWKDIYVHKIGEEKEFEYESRIGPFEIIITSGQREEKNFSSPSQMAILGKSKQAANLVWRAIKTEEPNKWTIEELTKLKEDLKKFLEPLNLWDETKFGVFAYLYESY